jgi:hypothetical protein
MRSDIWPLLRPLVRTVSLFLAVALGGLIGPLPRLGVIPPRSRQHHLDCVQGIGACCRPMKFLATSALLLTLTLPAIAQDYRLSVAPDAPALAPSQQALIAGIGRMSCAHWLSESFNEGEGWILGFWSGLTSRMRGR